MSLLSGNAVRGDPYRLAALQQRLGADEGLRYYDAWTVDQIDAFLASPSRPMPFQPGPGASWGGGGDLTSLPYGPVSGNLSLGDVGDWATKIGQAIGILKPPSSGPAGFPALPPTFPSSGPPTLPQGGGMPQLPQMPGGPSTGSMGGTIGRVGGAIARSGAFRTIARNIIPAIVGGVVGDWVYDTVRGWFFRPGKRHRHMNVLNPRALKRAVRREHGFKKLASKTLSEIGFTVHRKGSGGHGRGCGCPRCKRR